MNLQDSTHATVLIDGDLQSSRMLVPIPAEKPVVYEVIRVISGTPLFVEAHLERMNHSLSLAGFSDELNVDFVKHKIRALVKSCSVLDQNLRINVWPEGDGMKWTAFFVESSYPAPGVYAEGVKTGLLHMERHNPSAKVWQSTLKDAVAKACEGRGLYEMILVDSNGLISEGSRSNLFFTQGDTLVTAPDSAVLGGITRLKLLEIIAASGIPLVKREIPVSQLDAFDGAFITGTSIHLLPVNQIETWQRPSSEQPLIKALMEKFEACVQEYQKEHQIE